ncbi:Carbamoyl-phosphate synthase small chain [Streptomyces cyaneofuscatus]
MGSTTGAGASTPGKVGVTAHNHGFAVDAPLDKVSDTEFGRAEVSHVCLNDQVVEGLQLLDRPAFGVHATRRRRPVRMTPRICSIVSFL